MFFYLYTCRDKVFVEIVWVVSNNGRNIGRSTPITSALVWVFLASGDQYWLKKFDRNLTILNVTLK